MCKALKISYFDETLIGVNSDQFAVGTEFKSSNQAFEYV